MKAPVATFRTTDAPQRRESDLLPKLTVLVAANKGSHRAMLVAFLESQGHSAVIANDGPEALNLALFGGIDLAIVGPNMPGIDGYQLTRNLREVLPDLPVIMTSQSGPALRNVLLDCSTVLTGLGAAKLRHPRRTIHEASAAGLKRLTRREREVLDLVILGHGNKVVARLLSISPRTVENHRAQIMRKTKARSIAELVRLTLSDRDAAPAARSA